MSRELSEPSYGFTYPTILQDQSRSYQDGAKHAVTGLATGGVGGLPAGEYPAVKVGQRGQTLPSRHVSKMPLRLQAGCALLAGRGLNFTTSSAGTRPRSFNSTPCALAHSRTSVVFSPLAGPLRPLRAERREPPFWESMLDSASRASSASASRMASPSS
jgi:hypothetical protein